MTLSLKNKLLYQNPKLDYPIDNLDLSFADYILKNQTLIAKFKSNPAVVAANMPFELRPTDPNPKYGALLIHGLLDTPFIMRDVGTHLQSQGMLVRSILLPGHGTVPGALLAVHYEEWLQAVLYGVTSLLKEVEQVFLVGFSTGAALSIHHAIQQPQRIAGLIGLSPAFRIRSSLAYLSRWHRFFKWFNITEEIDYTKYLSIPFNAIYQVYRLTQTLPKKPLSCPLFIAVSAEDVTICSQAALHYFAKQSNKKNKMILYQQTPESFSDSRITVRHSVYPKWHILNFSHIAIPVAPENPHYGEHGDYPLASHVIEQNNYEYSETNVFNQFFHNILYRMKFGQNHLKRLTFNPDFGYLKKEISHFLLTI